MKICTRQQGEDKRLWGVKLRLGGGKEYPLSFVKSIT